MNINCSLRWFYRAAIVCAAVVFGAAAFAGDFALSIGALALVYGLDNSLKLMRLREDILDVRKRG